MKILIATGNPGKFGEIIKGLRPLINKGLKVFSLKDLKINSKLDETGKTFEENSLLKAKHYSHLAKIPTLADDGGLIIPYLNNGPGVLSRRWPGYEATDEELINYCLNRLRGVSQINRTAYLVANLCFYNPKTNKVIHQQEKVKGKIALSPTKKRIHGFPYRALFIVDRFNKFYDELTDEEHKVINHRHKAVTKLANRIKDLI